MKVGNRVKVISDVVISGSGLKGLTGEIVKISEVNSDFPYVVLFDDVDEEFKRMAFKAEELEVI